MTVRCVFKYWVDYALLFLSVPNGASFEEGVGLEDRDGEGTQPAS